MDPSQAFAQAQAAAAQAQSSLASPYVTRNLIVVSANLGLSAAVVSQLAGYPQYALPVGAAVAASAYLGYAQKYVPSQFYQFQHALGGASLGYLVGPSQGFPALQSAVVGGAAFAGLAYYLARGQY